MRYTSRAMSNPDDDAMAAPGYGAPPVDHGTPISAPAKLVVNASADRAAEAAPSRNTNGVKIGAVLIALLVIAVLIAAWIRASLARQRAEGLELARQAQRQIEQRQAAERESVPQLSGQPTVAPLAPVQEQPTAASLAAARIESAMRARVEQVGRRCFDIIEAADPTAYGHLSMRVNVNPVTGAVDIARLNHGSLPTAFVGCFRSEVEHPPIPIAPGASAGAPVEVRFSLDYGHPPTRQ